MLVFQFKIIVIRLFVWNSNMAAMAFVELVSGEWVQALYTSRGRLYKKVIKVNYS
jgi:hypothetical protein